MTSSICSRSSRADTNQLFNRILVELMLTIDSTSKNTTSFLNRFTMKLFYRPWIQTLSWRHSLIDFQWSWYRPLIQRTWYHSLSDIQYVDSAWKNLKFRHASDAPSIRHGKLNWKFKPCSLSMTEPLGAVRPMFELKIRKGLGLGYWG